MAFNRKWRTVFLFKISPNVVTFCTTFILYRIMEGGISRNGHFYAWKKKVFIGYQRIVKFREKSWEKERFYSAVLEKGAEMLSKLRNWILLIIAMFVLLSSMGLSTKTVFAAPEDEDQNPAIIIKAKGTYGDYTKQGVWLPLQVEVTNQGKDLQGDLRVTPSDNNMEFNAMDYVSKAVLPQGSTKGFNFYLPVRSFLTSVLIELVSEDKVIAQQTVKFAALSNNELIIGLLDRSEEGLTSLGGLKLAKWLSPMLTTVKNEDLPEKAELLNFYNILLINDVNLKLTKEQSTALIHWVSRGGILVVGGGSGWQKVLPNLPPELQVVTVSGVDTITLSTLPHSLSEPVSEAVSGPVRIANLQSSKGKPLFSEQGKPLAIEYPLGEGKVLYLAFDPAIEPISNWPGTKVLWKDLLIDEKSDLADSSGSGQFGVPIMVGQSNNSYGIANALGNIEDMALPSLRTMAWLICPYLLLAGLFNYLVLKKLDKREWTWITVPALSIVFVLLIYFTSFKTRPAEIIAHQINVAEMMPGTSLAKVTAVTGVFAPTHATYHLELPGKHLVNALPNINGGIEFNPQNQRLSPMIRVEQTPGQTNLDFMQMRSWVMRGFSSVEDASLTGSISGEISFQDNKWLATITNGTQYNFTDGVIVSSPNWFTKIPALNAGEKIQTEININMNNNLNNGAPLAYQIYNTRMNWQGSGPPPRPQAKDIMRQQIFESQLGDGWDPRTEGKLLFFAWSTEPFQGGLSIEDNKVKKYYTTLFQVPLDLKFDPENLEVPEGFISGRLLSSQNIGMGPGSIMMQPNSEAIYQMELPEGKFREMQLNIHSRNSSSFSATVKGYLYNWKTAAWDDINMTTDNTVIKDPANYSNSDRLVRFKVSNQIEPQSQSQSQFKQTQPFRDQEFYGISISLSSKGGGQ